MSERTIRRVILVLVVLQALVLLALPLRAGTRMPSGTQVRLAATEYDGGVPIGKLPPQELFLDYGFEQVELPEGIGPSDTAYLELLSEADQREPARFGRVVEDPADLPADSTWIKLPSYGAKRGELHAGPIEAWYSEDIDRVRELRDHMEEGGEVVVTVRLDTDGDPEIVDVEAVD